MNKNTIWIVVSLMAIALIGLSWFQFYWINSVLNLSKERFEKDALESMITVINKLERNEMALVATNSFSFFGTTSLHDTSEFIVENNTVVDIDSSSQRVWLKSNNNEKVKIVIHSDSNREIHEFIGDTSFTRGEVQITASISGDSAIAKTSIERIDKKRKVFTKVVEEMMFHELGQPRRVHPDIIDSLLSEEFQSHGIYLAYDFGILDSQKNEFRIVKSRDREELKNSILTASLFPNDILGNSLSLIVNFPDKNQFLIKQVWASLLTSFIFILIIIGTFSYVIYIIINQKKLADLKNDFINNMTHEFKTPIATVSLASEALQEEKVYSSRETMLRYVGVIQEESKRLGLQVEKVLQLASMDRDNLSLNKKNCSLSLLIESALDRARFQVEERNGDLSVNLSNDDITIMADETHFSNAIFNVLDNAIKYSKNGPKIELEVSTVKNNVIIEIRDQGIGLTQEQQKHIFDKFYRVPKGNVHDVKGFGLGLNYVKYIINGHEGEIDVESQPKKGSRFRISIPLKNDSI